MADCLFIAIDKEFIKLHRQGRPFVNVQIPSSEWDVIQQTLTENGVANINNQQDYARWAIANSDKHRHLLRQIAVRYIYSANKVLYVAQYQENYKALLFNAFMRFKNNQEEDDTFYPHPHIKAKFETLKATTDSDEIKRQLDNFWDNEGGAEQYFQTLGGTGLTESWSRARWGSNVELDTLGHVFGFRCSYTHLGKGVQTAGIGFSDPIQFQVDLNLQQLQLLVNRGIISSTDAAAKYFINIQDRDSLERQLSDISHEQQINDFLDQHKDDAELVTLGMLQTELRDTHKLQDQQIEKITQQLNARGVIQRTVTPTGTVNHFIRDDGGNIRLADIKQRLSDTQTEIKTKVLQKYNPNVPHIHLEHTTGHWSSASTSPQQKPAPGQPVPPPPPPSRREPGEPDSRPIQQRPTAERAKRSARGSGRSGFNDEMFTSALKGKGRLTTVVKRSIPKDNGYYIELNEHYGRAKIDHTGNRYVLDRFNPHSVCGLMTVMVAGGFEDVELSELIAPNNQTQLTLACTAARAAGLRPVLHGKPVLNTRLDPQFQQKLKTNLAPLWTREEKTRIKRATTTRTRSTHRPIST